MKLTIPTLETGKRAVTIVGVIVLAALVLGGVWWTVSRFLPRHDSAPAIVTARKDERAAAAEATAAGTATAAQNRDSTMHVEITTKDIRDAFNAPAPASGPVTAPAAGQPALPAAPVDRLRDRLNESIARANRAAGAAYAPD